MHTYISLDKIFGLQDQVFDRIRHEYSDRYKFAADCIELVINTRVTEGKLPSEIGQALRVVQSYQNDAFSALICSLKLCLYGCIADSSMLLRIAVEDLAMMSYVVNTNSYRAAAHRPKRLKFGTIVKKIPSGKEIAALHGRLSDSACHTTPTRLKNNHFKIGGEWLPRPGVAYDPEGSRKTLGEIDRASLYMLRILRLFYSQNPTLVSDEFLTKVDKMNCKIDDLKV